MYLANFIFSESLKGTVPLIACKISSLSKVKQFVRSGGEVDTCKVIKHVILFSHGYVRVFYLIKSTPLSTFIHFTTKKAA